MGLTRITSDGITDGAIVNADVNASAAIAGTKISPDFGSQSVVTTGTLDTGNATINRADITVVTDGSRNNGVFLEPGDTGQGNRPKLRLKGAGNAGLSADAIQVFHDNGSTKVFELDYQGNIEARDLDVRHADFSAGIDVTGAITGTGDLTIDTNTLHVDSSNNRVGIGTTSPSDNLEIASNHSQLRLTDTDDSKFVQFSYSGGKLVTRNNSISTTTAQFTLDESGKLGIGTISPVAPLHVAHSGTSTAVGTNFISLRSGASGRDIGIQFADGATSAYVGMLGGAIYFADSGSSEKMRIDSSGKVGIGTTTGAVGGAPSSQTGQFNVITSAGSGQWAMQARADNVAGNGLFLRAGNSSSYYTAYLTGYDENNVHMVVRGDGNVGIGTTSTKGKLCINASGLDAAGDFDDPNDYAIVIRNSSTTDQGNGIAFTNDDAQHVGGAIIHIDKGSNNLGDLAFFTAATSSTPLERMRIQSDGMIGCGTTGPKAGLHVATENATYGKSAVFGANGFIDSANYHYTDATISLLGQDADGNNKGAGVEFTARNSANSNWSHGSIVMERDGDFSFFTGGSGNYVGVEKMRIKTGGNVFIGDSVNSSGLVNSRGYIFETSGTMQIIVSTTADKNVLEIGNPNGNVGRIQAHANSTSYLTNSDYRLKENVVAISDGITRLKTLKPYRFNFKTDADTIVDGFFAHEVTAVPEAISGTKDEVALEDNEVKKIKKGDPIYQGIDQSKLVPLLVAALKEAISKIEILETEVAALKGS